MYALLSENEQGVAELLALSDTRPAGGLFIRGRADWVPWTDHAVPVRYGLEAYFMEQGLALEFEQLQIRDNIQVPLEMAVAVRGDGLAVLENHRWSALGIGLELQTGSSPNNSAGELSQPVLNATVRLLNASQKEQAIVDLPNAGSLAVVPDLRGGAFRWRWVGEEQKMPAPQADHVIVLKPGEVHTFHVDFRDPAWSVVDTSSAGSDLPSGVASLSDSKLIRRTLMEASQDWSVGFRLEYRSPSRDACVGLPHAELIWHGRLPTRAFSGGRVD